MKGLKCCGNCRWKLYLLRRTMREEQGLKCCIVVLRLAGRVDEASMHGGCPVLAGTKWAANLWVWNGPRCEYTTPFPNMCLD